VFPYGREAAAGGFTVCRRVWNAGGAEERVPILITEFDQDFRERGEVLLGLQIVAEAGAIGIVEDGGDDDPRRCLDIKT
jgi:hypothetical protein